MNYNNLKIQVYSASTTEIDDPSGDLRKAQGLRFSTGYPGGRYLNGSFYIPRNVVDWLAVKGAQRVVFRNGLKIVYEGWVDDLLSQVGNTEQGIEVNLTGAWGYYLMRRKWRKIWADQRITDAVWTYQTDTATYTGADNCTTDRRSQVKFIPKAEAWADGEFVACRYTMPTGETVKRLVYTYTLDEDSQSWEISVWRSTDASSWTQMTDASGETYNTGTTTVITADAADQDIDVELATASQYVELRFYSRAAQTPTSDGDCFGKFYDISVYSTTSATVQLDIIADDCVGELSTEFNSSVAEIDTPGSPLTLEPFLFDRWTSHADILTSACNFGDTAFNSWAAGCLHSESVASPDGKPVLFVEQFPALTDYDYAIRLDEQNLVPNFSLDYDYSQIWNWIVVEYYDENGEYQVQTPDDDANLTDSTSTTDYGQRDMVINVGSSTSTAAINSGRRFLAAYKDPQYRVSGPITVMGYIRGKAGNRVPCSEIYAGQRVKVENYLQDLSGTGLTFLISHTDYDDESETNSISIGPPGDLVFPRFVFRKAPPPDVVTGAGDTSSSSGGGRSNLNWKRRLGLEPGSAEWEHASNVTWAEKQEMIAEAKDAGEYLPNSS